MESACALRCEPPGELDGVAAFQGDLLAPPFAEPDDPSVEDVDRGDGLELTC